MGRSYDTIEPDESVVSADADELFEILSNANRRFVLTYLSRQDGSVELDSLADSLAEWSDDHSTEDARIALHHVHLPKLETADLVEYDGDVELADDAADSLAFVENP